MELGKTAHFAADDGTHKSVKITDAHIEALLSHAGNRAITSHLTHDWFSAQGTDKADTVEMGARIGALKKFRRDENGDLIADAYLKDGEDRRDICFSAEHTPDDLMLSAVFSYRKDDPQCLPIDFRAVDFVPTGAAVTALFKNQTSTAKMAISIDDLKEVLSTPEGKAMLRGCLDGHDDMVADNEKAAAEMESDAGVTDADKKKDDDTKPALMRAQLRISRATVRLGKAFVTEAGLKGEAAATALLGKGGFLKQGEDNKGDEYTAKLAEYRKSAPSDQVAAFRLLKDHPEFQGAHEAATAARCAKLSNKH